MRSWRTEHGTLQVNPFFYSNRLQVCKFLNVLYHKFLFGSRSCISLLPIEYWNPICLSHIASKNGKCLFTYSVTENPKRIHYTPVFVEVDANADFHQS